MTDVQAEPSGNYQRTISLTRDMAGRLQAVCDHLGLTASAYIKQAIGEAVAKHEVSLLAKQSKDSSIEILERLFAHVVEDLEKVEPKEKRPRAKAK